MFIVFGKSDSEESLYIGRYLCIFKQKSVYKCSKVFRHSNVYSRKEVPLFTEANEVKSAFQMTMETNIITICIRFYSQVIQDTFDSVQGRMQFVSDRLQSRVRDFMYRRTYLSFKLEQEDIGRC